MTRYEILYMFERAVDRGLPVDVEADHFRNVGAFTDFVTTTGDLILRLRSADIRMIRPHAS